MSDRRISFNDRGDFEYPPNELPSPLGYIDRSEPSTPTESSGLKKTDIKDDSIIEQTEHGSIEKP